MKRSLDISDIQDDEDIYDRLVLNQKKRSRKGKAKRLMKAPLLLSEQVRLMEEKINNISPHHEDSKETEKKCDLDIVSDEEGPVIVDSEHLLTPDIREYQSIHDRYEELELHKLFHDTRTNFMFRLFFIATMHDQGDNFVNGSTGDLFRLKLRDILAQQRAKLRMRRKFVAENYLPGKAAVALPSNEITRTTTVIKVPPRILELLD